MDQIYCTLFDSNYIDKGLVLYDSMCEYLKEFKLYVFAFDDRCNEILMRENLDNMVVVSLEKFETSDLIKIKSERSKAEYCWTCTPWIIKHVLEHYHERICTYIDSDMMFFGTPQCIFDDMRTNNCSIIITPHRYKNDKVTARQREKKGEFCVEFNTFLNDSNGLKALNWWAAQCLEWCYYSIPGTTEWYGDQKYLNVFPLKFDGVYICNHYGVGLAPWNVKQVKLASCERGTVKLALKKSREEFPLIIYHYESVVFLSEHIINTSSGLHSSSLHRIIYDTYVHKILAARKKIEAKYEYRIPRKKRILSRNIILRIYQRYVAPIKRIRSVSDLYWVKGD